MKCPYCGTVNEAGKTYCKHCGKALPSPKAKAQAPKTLSFRTRLIIVIVALTLIVLAWVISYRVHR